MGCVLCGLNVVIQILTLVLRVHYLPDINWDEVTKWRNVYPREYSILVKSYLGIGGLLTAKPIVTILSSYLGQISAVPSVLQTEILEIFQDYLIKSNKLNHIFGRLFTTEIMKNMALGLV